MANTKGKRKDTKPVDEVVNKVEKETVKEVVAEAKKETVKEVDETTLFINKKGTVNCPKLNVRKGPSLNSAIISIISEGDRLEVLKHVNDTWYKVRISDKGFGFCMKEFITLDK